MDNLPQLYLDRFVTGAEVHVHLTGSLKDFAANLHEVANQLEKHLADNTVPQLLDPKTTPLKFSRPIRFESGNEARIRLIETWQTGFDAAIAKLYGELEECVSDDTLFKEKTALLQQLQQLEADRMGRNRNREDSFTREQWDKLREETQKLLADYPKAGSTFKRLDRVVCKETQGVFLHAGARGVILKGLVDPTELMQHEDKSVPKSSVVWDGRWMKDRDDDEEYLDCLSSTHTQPVHLELADPLPTDPIYLLQALIYDMYYPNLDTKIDGRVEQTSGPLFLDISGENLDNRECAFTVEFLIGSGFGFCTCGDPGYGPHRDEVIEGVEEAFTRVQQLIDSGHHDSRK